MGKINIILVQIVNRNYGDAVIADNTEYLIKNILSQAKEDDVHIYPYNIYSEDYSILTMANLIIFAGGGIVKYKYEEFHYYVSKIIEHAQLCNIPIFFNAVGIEGYDANSDNCMRLKKWLNASCVKGITVRDDIDTLQKYYITNTDIRIKEVYDSAVYTAQTYNVIRKENPKPVIGLGIIRYAIFGDNGISEVTKKHLLEFWENIIIQLDYKGIAWKLFTNGAKDDEEFATEILEYVAEKRGVQVHTYQNVRVARPLSSKDLVENISEFTAIIAGRLHSNIIAYALQIPSIGLVWNDKLRFWGEKIGYPERFLEYFEMIPKVVLNRLNIAMQQGYQFSSKAMYNTTKEELAYFINKYTQESMQMKICPPSNNNLPKDISNRLMVAALGGIDNRYCNMNTSDTIEQSYNAGFRMFEVDVRLSSDGKVVCVNGWSESIFRKLNLPYDENMKEGMLYDEFLNQAYWGRYVTLSLHGLAEAIRKYQDIRLMIDIGKPSKTERETIINEIYHCFQKSHILDITIRLQRRDDAKYCRNMQLPYRLAFHLPASSNSKHIESILPFFKEQKIDLVTLRKGAFQKEIIEKLNVANIQICLFSSNSFTEVQDFYQQGIYVVATHYLNIKHLETLFI